MLELVLEVITHLTGMSEGGMRTVLATWLHRPRRDEARVLIFRVLHLGSEI